MSIQVCSDCGSKVGWDHGDLCSQNPKNTTTKLLLLILKQLEDINSNLIDVENAERVVKTASGKHHKEFSNNG